jgi:hypothetical protein
MRFYYSILFLWLLPLASIAQRPLTPDAEKVKKQFGYLRFEERAALSHVDYITAFPKDKTTFLDVFYPWQLDQLYEDRHKYVDALKKIGEQYPRRVLERSIGICKDLRGNEDVVGEMQDIVIGLGNNHTFEFISETRKLNKEELRLFSHFLADARDRDGVLSLVVKLKKKKESKMADAIVNAMVDKDKETE